MQQIDLLDLLPKSRRPLEERVGRDADARADRTAPIGPGGIDGIERRGGAKIADEQRSSHLAILRVRRDGAEITCEGEIAELIEQGGERRARLALTARDQTGDQM